MTKNPATARTNLMFFDHIPLVLADDDAPPTTTGTPTTPPTTGADGTPAVGPDGKPLGPTGDQQSPGGPGSMMFILLIAGAFMFMLMMGGRRDKKKRANLIASLKKGDKVQTIGGIIGTLVEVRDHQVVVKVDENSNTRMHFSREAIQGVIGDREGDSKKDAADEDADDKNKDE